MLCVTGVYLRDITNTIFVILHFNVSQLSVCSHCYFYVRQSDNTFFEKASQCVSQLTILCAVIYQEHLSTIVMR